jgi:hypothetical protein
MRLQERSYSTKMMRPKPLIHSEDDGSLIVITTSWGQPEHAGVAQEEIVKYVNAAKSDVEVTSPFEFLSCLTDEVNYLRISLLIANDILYRGENKSGYHAGVEALVLFQRDLQLAWAHVGFPSVLIKKRDRGVQPLSVGADLSAELSSSRADLAPLPAQMMGIDPTCNIHCGHTKLSEGDQVILISSNKISSALWLSESAIDFNTVTKSMIQDSPDSPFWLGLIQFE